MLSRIYRGIATLLLFLPIYSVEFIQNFSSDITVHKNGAISITETIKVHAKQRQIQRGIMREFPTQYYDRYGNYYNVRFDVKEVLLNGEKVPYRIADYANGKIIYIGEPKKMLSPGVYTYTIAYQTNRQLGYFKTWDELFWNVTGQGWRLPIAKSEATVHLPNVPANKIKVEAYTGRFGAKGKDYTAWVSDDGIAHFETTKLLKPFEGLSIVTSWPKGYVEKPSLWERIQWFFKDNIFILLSLLALLGLLIFYWLTISHIRKKNPPGTIIPLFEPSADLSAADVRYIEKMGYDDKVFAAQIVEWAVQGYLTIHYHKRFWRSGYYELKKINDLDDPVFETLFKEGDSLILQANNQNQISKAINTMKAILKIDNEHLFEFHDTVFVTGIVISIISLVFALAIQSIFIIFIIIALIAINIIAFNLLKKYTQKGRRIKDEIEGFKLFLETTEKDRLKVIGTPPEKTPELYEKYLPYAIALGVEEQWSKKFAPVFKELEMQHRPYQPVWFIGRPFTGSFTPGHLASNLSSSITSSISSSYSAPGTFSGRRGGGGAGGGGGGGGGGGW